LFINVTLSRVQQWAQSIYEIAQDFVEPGNHCNNPAESIIIIDAVDGVHDKKWAETQCLWRMALVARTTKTVIPALLYNI